MKNLIELESKVKVLELQVKNLSEKVDRFTINYFLNLPPVPVFEPPKPQYDTWADGVTKGIER